MKPKPILLVTLDQHGPADPLEVADRLRDSHEFDGYAVLVILGPQTSVRLLSPRKMKRADYALVKKAAQRLLK